MGAKLALLSQNDGPFLAVRVFLLATRNIARSCKFAAALAEVRDVQSQLKLARLSYRRREEFVNAAAVSREEFEQTELVVESAGESAPTFYYNVIPRRKNTARCAQGLVQLRQASRAIGIIHELQECRRV